MTPNITALSAEAVQNIALSLLGVPYKLGAEYNITDDPTAIPGETDCSESVQFIYTAAKAAGIGDGAWLQWAKCVRTTVDKLPFGGLAVLFNNRKRPSPHVGHIAMLVGTTRFGTKYVLESRGYAWGTVLTRLRDFTNPALRGKGAVGTYPKFVVTGKPDTLFAWRGYHGPATRKVQTALQRHGFTTKIDADFGPKTQLDVKNWQIANGFYPSGAVTGKVWKAMQK